MLNTILFSTSPLISEIKKLSEAEINKLIENLSSPKSQIRCNAARRLGHCSRYADKAYINKVTPKLIELLTHSDLSTAEAADGALVNIGTPAVPFLKDVLGNGTETMRERAVTCLGNMRDKASGALSVIRDIANQNDEKMGVRFAAVWAVGNIVSKLNDYPEINAVVKELTDMLNPDYSHICYCAAEALGKIGKRAKSAIPYLKPLLKAKNENVQSYAKWALTQIAPEVYGGAKNIIKPVKKTYKEFIKSIEEAKKEEERLKSSK